MYSVFVNDDSAVRIEPSASADAQTYVNGMLITSPTNLQHVRILIRIMLVEIFSLLVDQYFSVHTLFSP